MDQNPSAGRGLPEETGLPAPPALHLGDLRIEVPIIQGGMGVGVSLSGLASAVAARGGVGVIATAGIGWDEPDLDTNFRQASIRALARHIRRAREATDGVIGVNIMTALTNYDDLAATAVTEGADIIFSGAGLPLSLPKHVQSGEGTKLVPIVSSGRAADIVCRKWKARFGRYPDAFVVEGPKAGGHLGFKPEDIERPEFALEAILPKVVEAAALHEAAAGRPIPVIAAGGIYTGADMLAAMRLGAAACQLGTRFVATHECDAADRFKELYLRAGKEDIHIIKSPVGMPGRAISNTLVREAEEGRRMPDSCRLRCLAGCKGPKARFCIFDRLTMARAGDVEEGLVFAGENAWRVNRIVSVAELMDSLLREYGEAVLAQGGSASGSKAVAAMGWQAASDGRLPRPTGR